MAEEKRPRWESEIWKTQGVSEKIVCKTCIFRYIEINGEKVERPDASDCEIYVYPDMKPSALYFNGEECEYYEREKGIKNARPNAN